MELIIIAAGILAGVAVITTKAKEQAMKPVPVPVKKRR